MSKFSSKERSVAKFLNKYPKLKGKLKYFYQYFTFQLHKKAYSFQIDERVSLKKISNDGISSFWGYYDKTPNSGDNYCYHALSDNLIRKRNSCTELDIYLNNHKISSTTSWNWQQGAMLTWLSESEIIHNFHDPANGYRAKIINVLNKNEIIINFPIYSVHKEKRIALTLNFNRLAKLRPDYGYFCEKFDQTTKTDFNDGISVIDLDSKEAKLVISFRKLLNFHSDQSMKNAWHKVNHIDFSPSGDRFMFHHRWFSDEGIKKSRLITANIDGTDLHLLANDGMVSHCTWRGKDEIVGWMTKNDLGDKYFLLKDKTTDFSPFADGLLCEDGHPGFSSDLEWMLTDTYPDKSRMSSILLYNLSSNKLYNIGEFFSPLKFTGELRCDLHPRFNPCGNKITFDSVHEGVRGLYELDITKIVNQ
ncbi:hypothetical protein [Maribacter stanieri]|uniref:hypothetical protein n=1 Tax=Maribacter stanieri TaxID=440514 RepID=UPI00249548E2|nr:hypothetical protein [Maribacter stanieri]